MFTKSATMITNEMWTKLRSGGGLVSARKYPRVPSTGYAVVTRRLSLPRGQMYKSAIQEFVQVLRAEVDYTPNAFFSVWRTGFDNSIAGPIDHIAVVQVVFEKDAADKLAAATNGTYANLANR